jgi:UDP-N-acetylmuramoyl-L-alanyl-D-glutamate--2,6-diaminopimelate ligase
VIQINLISPSRKRLNKLNPNLSTTLDELIAGCSIIDIKGPSRPIVESVCYDSRKAKQDSLFIAIRGAQSNGEQFIGQALANGSTVIMAESPYSSGRFLDIENTTYVQVENCRETLSLIASKFYKEPSKKLQLFGITGTNGKTTVAYILESIFQSQEKTGVIGTINSRYSGKFQASSMTTPESLDLNRVLSEMVQDGIKHCFLEVSSHALALQRVDNLHFETVLFTNLTRDHLDFHPTFEDYKETKKSLFKKFPKAKAIINIDDPVGLEIVDENPSINFFKIGLNEEAEIRATDILLSPEGTKWTLQTPFGNQKINSKLLGVHNVYNQLVAAAGALSQKMPLEIIAIGLEKIKRVPGRFDSVEKGQPFSLIVDYAHTEDALRNVLKACKSVTQKRIILAFGCGGDRDRGKRPKMGQAAFEGADFLVVTSDNPRTENPDSIIDDVCKGFPETVNENVDFIRVSDRRKAINRAIEIAQPGDLVLIAGKGHEDYQILNSKTISFDDREVAIDALAKRYSR